MANVIDGEASETDEEEDDQNDDVPTIVETTVSNYEMGWLCCWPLWRYRWTHLYKRTALKHGGLFTIGICCGITSANTDLAGPKKGMPRNENSRKIIHVDERIQQHWKHLATNTQAVLWKRNQPAVKMAQEQKELTHKTFETVQSAATSLRTASLKLLQIEDGLADIRDAAALLPSAFEKTKIEIIKIL